MMKELPRREFVRQVSSTAGGGILGGFLSSARLEAAPSIQVPAEGILNERETGLLKRWDAPTIANAIERIKGVRFRTEGFTNPEIQTLFPELGPMVGYAVTATIKASEPAKRAYYVDRFEYYEFIQSIPAPRIMVIHDEDYPNAVGSFWGEVHGSLHRALGCVGVITDGGVRDLGPVRALRFHYFAARILVSHAHVHLVNFGTPVKVGGLTVKPGDLLFGDEHGVIQIPHSMARKAASLCYEVYKSERPAIDFYQSPDFSIEKLREFFDSRGA
jgi:regulator of RNase E activity RraA